MENAVRQRRLRAVMLLLPAAAAAFLLRGVLRELALQLGAAYLLMAMALPLCRLLERRLTPGISAVLAFTGLGAAAVALLLLLIPPLVRQFRQLSESLPALADWVRARLEAAQAMLLARGVDLSRVQARLTDQVQELAARIMTWAADAMSRTGAVMGRLFLAPLFAFYLLRDRRRIAENLTLLFPVQVRARAVRAAREMRRETAGFLRGQLLISGLVGVMTALGLLAVGTPGWLLLGLLMGVQELVPYIGPLIAGIPAVLLALQGGWARALWTLAVLVAVQQAEGSLLSPRLLSGATRLHPLLILLIISAGGFVAGAWGMLLALPLAVSIRGAVRGARV